MCSTHGLAAARHAMRDFCERDPVPKEDPGAFEPQKVTHGWYAVRGDMHPSALAAINADGRWP